MKRPTQEDIDGFLLDAKENIAESVQDYKDGYYEKKNIPIQSVYTSMADYYADLARAKFLNGEPLSTVRQEFATAVKYMIKSFTMAYDPNDPEYVGDKWPPKNPHYTGHKDSVVEAKWLSPGYGQVSWANVMETRAIEGFNWALMGANIELGRELAGWYQDSKDGDKMDADVNRYTYAWKYALLGEAEKGAALLQQTIDEYTAKPPKNGADLNYFTLSLTLSGILTKDEILFNQGLEQVLKFHQEVMIPSEDLWDSDERYICDHAVALANLAAFFELSVTIEHDLLPKGLLIEFTQE